MTNIFVKFWMKRFEAEGIKGLGTRPGQMWKPIMNSTDEEAVYIAIENDRQSLMKEKEAWLPASGKEAGEKYSRIRKRPRGKNSLQLYAYPCFMQ